MPVEFHFPLGIISAVFVGWFIRLLYRLIEKASDRRGSPSFQATTYLAIHEVLARGDIRIGQFVLFRILPPGLILTFYAASCLKYLPGQPAPLLITIAAAVYLGLTSGRRMTQRWVTLAEKRLILGASLLVCLISAAVALATVSPDGSRVLLKLAPSTSGIVDGLWTSLLAALLVVGYLEATNMGPRRSSSADPTTIDRFVIEAHKRNVQRFRNYLDPAVRIDRSVRLAVSSILILEQINRPTLLRVLEWAYVLILHRGATQGVAQVWSTSLISDTRSVELLLQRVGDALEGQDSSLPNNFENILPALVAHNDNPEYPAMIEPIVNSLLQNFPSEFVASSR